MGWFTRNRLRKSPPGECSLTAPPNVYGPKPLPPLPPSSNAPPPPMSQGPAPGNQQPQRQPPPPPPPPRRRSESLQPPPYVQDGCASQSRLHLEMPGYLPAAPGWNPHGQCQPVIVNQHYYLSPPQPGPDSYHQQSALGRFSQSMVNLVQEVAPPLPERYNVSDSLEAWQDYGNRLAASTSAAYDEFFNRFNNVMTLIDCERLHGNEGDLYKFQPPPPPDQELPESPDNERALYKPSKKAKNKANKGSAGHATTALVTSSYFSKVELYANSKLPKNLPPLALYIPTWPLLCLAAKYSQRVYDKPAGAERDYHVSSDWRTGTKAMCIKSVANDDMNTIVFAIRGTATFMDWAVNLRSAPVPPTNFLDDPGNLCHAGFLRVARKMIRPVALRLRQLLQEKPGRSSSSLMITGHSAGGAVAALLYMHMLAQDPEASSELNQLTNRFKRIHCVTFGTPPVSLLPLLKPERPELRKSLFLSFVNEGDPVVRADKAYVKSLLELLALPPPVIIAVPRKKQPGMRRNAARGKKTKPPRPVWRVPPSTLSNAGRIVVLRSGDPKARIKDRKTVEDRLNEGVVAVTCAEEMLRGVIWGDPVAHMMSFYAKRIEVLAVAMVTGKIGRT